ncbi:MAG: acyl-CoA dehydrogenase family protein [Yaniella sp.]|uniref:acyl-CoA dehydrogenase family protein n=1 Tax=Yaniella sp. TaxID=2773929 RepID=UPI002649A5C3|nr:acyl-CoA dehydrogenase family protein [Yaniella sp.]MDN5705289.1 acyl-CoA dehydrogenase family protein [Yaniella sp.]MDN5731073.1 acyl-CoA dehydrogenase family protein [Yaniella sp.]MDN5741890.1 acyl-CoA dehydrogenase family protein [Yaniella sp.]MDN5814617.1 acyl-CoA dehydrogenase family protein [Yaniella sp.]MDN5817520.1 acyl-CoA dehydrogenase family protein [Yaniella sp.]
MSQAPSWDVYGFSERLTAAEKTVLDELRTTLTEKVYPYLNDAWHEDRLPEEIIEPLQSLRLMNPAALKEAGESVRGVFESMRTFELARCDTNVATFFNAQAGLFRTVVKQGGSAEQVAELDPKIVNYELLGVFALTEPEHGSDVAGGLQTTASQNDDGTWTINGAKRWIGGAFQADVLCTFARDTADNQVKAFLVPREAEGVSLEKIERKASLRIMQNADIYYDNVQVPGDARLLNINSFRDVAKCLRLLRSDVSWIAAGAMAGAYEAAVRYTTNREQFGKPIAGFQLIQEKLATMLGNVTASVALAMQLTEQQDAGVYKDENSALAKMFTASKLRETVALAREVCGGNGITLDTDVARFHADAEAVYSYEGTHEINALIVGRAITGQSAFA